MTAAFLTLDGLDGTGKTTQCRRLADWLRSLGRRVTAVADPGGTDLGAELRELLLFGREVGMSARAEALLFMASRAELVDRVIRPALGRGDVVVSDRFTLSSVVYQGHAGGLPPADVWELGRIAAGGLEPDLTVVLDIPVEVARSRRGVGADRFESRGDDFFRRVRAGFLAEAANPARPVAVVDAGPSADVVHERVKGVVRGHFRAAGRPLPDEGGAA